MTGVSTATKSVSADEQVAFGKSFVESCPKTQWFVGGIIADAG